MDHSTLRKLICEAEAENTRLEQERAAIVERMQHDERRLREIDHRIANLATVFIAFSKSPEATLKAYGQTVAARLSADRAEVAS